MTWKEELNEFERLARSASPGDAEAYGHNLEEDKGDSNNISKLDEQKVNLQILGEQIPEFEDNVDGGDASDIFTNQSITFSQLYLVYANIELYSCIINVHYNNKGQGEGKKR